MQLVRHTALVLAVVCGTAVAEDRTEVSTLLFAEKRDGDKGGLLVIHPQASFGVDIGRFVTFDVGYAADAVSGATSTVYQVDAVSTATKFSDLRNEGTLSLGFKGRRSRITFGTTVGTEREERRHGEEIEGGRHRLDRAHRRVCRRQCE